MDEIERGAGVQTHSLDLAVGSIDQVRQGVARGDAAVEASAGAAASPEETASRLRETAIPALGRVVDSRRAHRYVQAMQTPVSPRELAYCGVFGAAALLLPVLFHLVHLGSVFMPMYLPLMTLPFLVGPLPAALTALIAPLLSGAVTGMPPFYPPVAVFMAIELAVMAAIIARVTAWRPATNPWLVLTPVLLLGRILHVALVYAFSRVIDLPAAYVAGLTLLSGWPGIVLMLVVIPPVARICNRSVRRLPGPTRTTA